jgi:hypothetical protein
MLPGSNNSSETSKDLQTTVRAECGRYISRAKQTKTVQAYENVDTSAAGILVVKRVDRLTLLLNNFTVPPKRGLSAPLSIPISVKPPEGSTADGGFAGD